MTLHDLLRAIDSRLLMIKIEEPNRANCNWLVGLDDNKGEPQLNYIKCESEEDANKLKEEILSKDVKYKKR